MNITPSGGAGSTSMWGGDAAVAFGLGNAPGFGAEFDGGYHVIPVTGASDNLWNIGGSVFWADFPGRVGGTLSYSSVNVSAGGIAANGNATTYGGFLEYYLGDLLTAGVKGGASSLGGSASGSGASTSTTGTGIYAGGALIGYVGPYLALSGNILYENFSGGHSTKYYAGAEYLISEVYPVSLSAGYMNSQVSGTGGGRASAWLVMLTIYTSGMGATLREDHRNGTLGWISNSGLQPAL